jgi:antitoxin (DNA-binding transcriptional repressor) of toxin-antitoxin stability system
VTELPIDDAAGLTSAAHDAAERGQVVHLTDSHGRRIAAIVPASVAAAGTAAIAALEDAADLAIAQEALAEWEADERRTYRLADIDAELSEG